MMGLIPQRASTICPVSSAFAGVCLLIPVLLGFKGSPQTQVLEQSLYSGLQLEFCSNSGLEGSWKTGDLKPASSKTSFFACQPLKSDGM